MMTISTWTQIRNQTPNTDTDSDVDIGCTTENAVECQRAYGDCILAVDTSSENYAEEIQECIDEYLDCLYDLDCS